MARIKESDDPVLVIDAEQSHADAVTKPRQTKHSLLASAPRRAM